MKREMRDGKGIQGKRSVTVTQHKIRRENGRRGRKSSSFGSDGINDSTCWWHLMMTF